MSSRRIPGTVYLVGAGPGSADLITMRGCKLVTSCDALVYDHLVAQELVEMSSARTRYYVGKVAGSHAMPQDKINELLVELATKDGGPERIVRLKGGDPFVFGRGGEEALACLEAGVPFEVVPGVSAGVAAPASVGVPVTHRDMSHGVVFLTGHARGDGELQLPWDSLASCGLTLVFFMGVSTIDRISRELMSRGMAGSTPALVIQEATTPSQRHVLDRLETIGDAVRAEGLRPPALLVVGEVASFVTRFAGKVSTSQMWAEGKCEFPTHPSAH